MRSNGTSDLDTGDRDIYTDDLANREDLTLRQKVDLENKIHNNRYASEIVINLKNGTSLVNFFDVGAPSKDINTQEERLTTKFLRLASPIIGDKRAEKAVSLVNELDSAANVNNLMAAVKC